MYYILRIKPEITFPTLELPISFSMISIKNVSIIYLIYNL